MQSDSGNSPPNGPNWVKTLTNPSGGWANGIGVQSKVKLTDLVPNVVRENAIVID
jgi:hypothetical protein